MKSIIKRLLFSKKTNRILSGVSSGMLANYDPKHRTIHLLGLYEREIYPFITKSIKKADTLIDVGANDGYYGLAFLKYKGKDVVLCEPNVEEQQKLLDNLTLNNFKQDVDFKLINKFVTGNTNSDEVTLNELVKNKKNVFVLIDVDGGEQKIVEGFDFNSNVNVEWLIETHSIELEKSIVQTLTGHKFNVKIIDSAWWRVFVPELRPIPHNRWLYASKAS